MSCTLSRTNVAAFIIILNVALIHCKNIYKLLLCDIKMLIGCRRDKWLLLFYYYDYKYYTISYLTFIGTPTVCWTGHMEAAFMMVMILLMTNSVSEYLLIALCGAMDSNIDKATPPLSFWGGLETNDIETPKQDGPWRGWG